MVRNHPKHVVGRSLPRVDIIEKVTGAAHYSRDSVPPNAMSLALVGSPHPHLRIHRIDVTEALQVPGIVRVITAHDLPGPSVLRHTSQPYLAGLETRYQGEAIALIVARDEDAAQRATQRINIESEQLPAVITLTEALAFDAPQVSKEQEPPNIWKSWQHTKGDPTSAFAESDQVVEQLFTSEGQTLDLLESPIISTQIDAQDGLQIRGSTNHPYLIQDTIAHLLDLPHNRIQVIQHALRGNNQGYALRSSLMASYAALATWITGYPVTLSLPRSSALRWFGHRPQARINIKYGANRDGQIQACAITAHFQVGAYPHDLSPLLHRVLAHACGPYTIPNLQIEVVAVSTHTPPSALLPGYGQMATCFARESMLDQLAQRLRIDPVRMRQINVIQPGGSSVWGQPLEDISGLVEALTAVTQAAQWSPPSQSPEEAPSQTDLEAVLREEPSAPAAPVPDTVSSPSLNSVPSIDEHGEVSSSPPETLDLGHRQSSPSHDSLPGSTFTWTGAARRQRGWGVALAHMGLTTGGESTAPQAMASIQIQRDGTVLLNVPQINASSDNQTRLTQMTAETLAVPFESIRILAIDTTRLPAPTPWSLPTSMFLTGQALLKAAHPLREQLLDQASLHWNCSVSEISTGVGRIFGPNDQSMAFSEAVRLCWEKGLPMARFGFHSCPTTVALKTEEPPTSEALHYPAFAYGAYFAEVEIDLDSQEVELLTLYVACDIGKVLNPTLARHQLIRGAYRGLAYTLFQAPNWRGEPEQMSLSHPLRVLGQVPEIHPILIEQPHSDGPLGHKGLDYLPALGIAPAVTNAIAQALGQRVHHLPFMPESSLSQHALTTNSFTVPDSATNVGANT